MFNEKGKIMRINITTDRDNLLSAMKELFIQCAMIHKYGGDNCNQKESDAAIKAGREAITKAEQV